MYVCHNIYIIYVEMQYFDTLKLLKKNKGHKCP